MSRLARLGVHTGLGIVKGSDLDDLAEQTTEVLGSLRGLATKVGQMLGTVDGLLPDTLAPAYRRALAKLQDSVTTSAFSDVSRVIEQELGASPDRLFSSFDPEPFASASIGQVHRARLADGRIVAVKVQHPGVQRAVMSDLANARLIERFAEMLVPKGFDSRKVFDEIAQRFREELDYRIEARHQRQFRELHGADPEMVIPDVIPERSARRVLTTELVEGTNLATVLGEPEALRHRYASTLWRFVYRSILSGGVFNADPHPGNFLFRPDGTIAFLDFGCVQAIPDSRRAIARRAHAAAASRDERTFAECVHAMLSLRGGSFERLIQSYTRRAFEPLFASPFRLTHRYVRELLDEARSAKGLLIRNREPVVPLPPGLALMNRLQFGFYSLLGQLDVSVDYAALHRNLLAESS